MIAHRRGHNFKATGAKLLISEVEESEKINKYINYYLDLLKEKHIDCSPSNMTSNEDLKYGVDKANNSKASVFFSVHFNSSENKKVDKPIGVEVWEYDGVSTLGTKLVNNLSSLGFKNRGVKSNKSYYELRNTKMKSYILEICFVNSVKDVELYKKIGAKQIAKTIVETVTNKKINESDNKKIYYRVVTDSYSNKENAQKRVEELKKQNINSFITTYTED